MYHYHYITWSFPTKKSQSRPRHMTKQFQIYPTSIGNGLRVTKTRVGPDLLTQKKQPHRHDPTIRDSVIIANPGSNYF